MNICRHPHEECDAPSEGLVLLAKQDLTARYLSKAGPNVIAMPLADAEGNCYSVLVTPEDLALMNATAALSVDEAFAHQDAVEAQNAAKVDSGREGLGRTFARAFAHQDAVEAQNAAKVDSGREGLDRTFARAFAHQDAVEAQNATKG